MQATLDFRVLGRTGGAFISRFVLPRVDGRGSRRRGVCLVWPWQLLSPVTHAPTRHLNREVQIMGTRWTLGGHTSDTRWTQRWTHDAHCENTAFCARPRTSNSRTKQVPKGGIRFLVFLQCPSSVHRCVHRASGEGPSLCPSLPGLNKLAVIFHCADARPVESRPAERQIEP